MDTIFALATARGKAGVAVIRVSGPDAFSAVQVLCGNVPEPRRASLRILRDGDGEPLDEGIVLTFSAGHSFTGEDSAEFQIHGSTATISAVLDRLAQLDGLRLADPGEFTRRALENGCLDLAQIEGLADLIDAETEAQRKQAQRVLAGALGAMAEGWRTKLIRAVALLEATIDFADEDVPVDVAPEVTALLREVLSDLKAQSDGTRAAERIRDGFEVAIVGPPNVGKSTLLNALAGRDAAITSEFAGTTRDVIEVRMDLAGLPVTVLDTAGIRVGQDHVERIGIERAKERADHADLRVFLLEQPGDVPDLAVKPGDIVVVGKADLLREAAGRVSGRTGQGVAQLIDNITKKLSDVASSAGLSIRERHKSAMVGAMGALESAQAEVMNGADRAELAAEELHSAIRKLDSLVGRVDVEHVLDEIFASFCLGK